MSEKNQSRVGSQKTVMSDLLGSWSSLSSQVSPGFLESDDGIHRHLSMDDGGILDKHNDLCMIISRGDADADNYRSK